MFSSRCCTLAQRSSACRSTLLLHPLAPARAAFSSSVVARHNTSAPATVAQNVQRSPQSSTSPKNSENALRSQPLEQQKAAREETPQYTLEDQLAQLDKLHAIENSMPFDVWAHRLDTFDVQIPTWYSRRKGAGILDHLRAFWNAENNFIKNTIAMYRIATSQSFPGVRVRRWWSPNLLRIQSTPWLQPFLKIALETYKNVNQAFAAGDAKTVKKLTVNEYYDQLQKRLRAQNPNLVYVWKFHGENKPCKVVSVRAADVNLSRLPVKYGSRLAIQALVKFDTMQSLEVFTKKGDRVAGDGTPRRVVEHLIFQKRMWFETPWTIRGQLYEELEVEYKNTEAPNTVRVRAG